MTAETSMPEIEIDYQFMFPDKRELHYGIRLDPDTLIQRTASDGSPPSWTHLATHPCPGCPLDPARHRLCPMAVSLAPLVEEATGLFSYEQLDLKVKTPERTISAKTTAQRAISSLMGLLIATSGCPHTTFFKPMARFHLPLASTEETVYRAASTYLLAQYFRHRDAEKIDLELTGLREIYARIHEVNKSMAARIRAASEADSGVNAIVILDLFAQNVPHSIDESLAEIRYLFKPLLGK